MPQFVDEARVFVESGKGGNGCVSFRREKFVPRGGPDGGDGGDGGSIIFVGTPRKSTLLDFKHRSILKAQPGGAGRGKKQHGSNGRTLVLEVPLGTQIFDESNGFLLHDLTVPGHRVVVAKGGRGGRGNVHFATPTRQTPDFSEPGGSSRSFQLRLELKVMARVGLLGFPNAGKSTFLSRVTHAHPRIASYPFTTLHPHLGVLVLGTPPDDKEIVVADLPGLIEGAHEGKGLGIRFLKHVERTEVLLHFVDLTAETMQEPEDAYAIVRNEVLSFNPELARKPEFLVGTKKDAADPDRLERFLSFLRDQGRPELVISSHTGEGLPELLSLLGQTLPEFPPVHPEYAEEKDGEPTGPLLIPEQSGEE
ncbi:MAG: GTPase ObgE [Leptospirales bacterium]